MTIEEKAKAYDNVREKIAIRFGCNVAKDIFSEYEESEDERIRKEIIIYLKSILSNKKYGDKFIESWIAWLEKQGEKGIKGNDREIPFDAWSEEDKKLWVHDDDIFLDAAKMIVEDSPRKSYGGVHKKEIVPWFYSLKERLKSLKDRVQPKQEWSEKDDKMRAAIIFTLAGFMGNEDKINWLKSLKDKYAWKPSDRQMQALKEACDEHWEPDGLDPLYTLYQNLKKLREE